MESAVPMIIKDNAFARQFETIVEEGLVTVEYSFQEKKIFLTTDHYHNFDILSQIITKIVNHIDK